MGNILKGIEGERFPVIGAVTGYRVTFVETADLSTINDNEISWQIYWSNPYSEYEKVPFSGQKKGRLTTYKFLQNLQGKNLQLKATYKNETVELHITPQANGEIKIIDVFFLDVEYKIQNPENLKYMNSVNLQIYTLNMLGKYVEFKIYDTVNGQDIEVAKSTEPMQIVQKNGIVKTKRAILLSPAMYMHTQQDRSANEHHYKVKVWEMNNEENFYEEELKVKNEMGQMNFPQDSQTPVKTGTSEPEKKEEEKENGAKCERCTIIIKEEIDQIFISANESKKKQIMAAFNEANVKFGINTCQQKAHFFAQVLQEVGTSINVNNGESLNYSAEALTGHFTKFSKTGLLGGAPNELAYKYGRSKQNNFKANQEMIANIAYANRNGNGDVSSGDGWRYRGRGIIQITGKDKYLKINKRIAEDYPEFQTVIDASNINNLREGTIASMAYWKEYGCKAIADKGTSRKELDKIVDIINSKTPTRNQRWNNLEILNNIFKTSECYGKH